MGAREEKAKAELIAKLHTLAEKHQTTPGGLFELYDADHSGELSPAELARMLKAADVGNGLTRGVYVNRIFGSLDDDKSGGLTLGELDAVIASDRVATPSGKLTRAEAAAIARRIAAGEDVDLSSFTQAEIALIEDENLKLTEPIPQPTKKPGPSGKSARASNGGAAWLIAAVAVLLVMRG